VHLDHGRFVGGYWCEKPDALPVPKYIESLFQAGPDGASPALSAALFPYSAELPAQAAHALINTYRELYWRIVDAVEKEFPGEGKKRAQKVSTGLASTHSALAVVSVPRAADTPDAVVRPEELAAALADWARQLLEGCEIMMPGVAVKVLREATREHRYVLQAAGFYSGLPWQVTW
jgi:hypothetical protein